MEIECEGCYYTVCSFVCLTEDLSEILQFLWRHGCLRKSYNCERCGRKCAIGDKDLFFRCNRNTIDASESEQAQFLHSTSSSATPESNGGSNYTVQNLEQTAYNDDSFERGRSITHPALRHNTPLPGDPQPPTQPSPVFFIDRLTERIDGDEDNFLATIGRNPTVLHAVKMEDIPRLPNAELADLDSQQASHRKKSLRSQSSNQNLKKRCNFKISMKKGTIFEKSKLPIDTVCKFVVFWCCMKQPTQEFLRNELSLASRTVVDWSTTCREICINWAKENSEKIGGQGVVVQVDEVKVAANNKPGDPSGHVFSFWGIEKDKDKGRLFIVPVPISNAWTLLSVVNDWILPGSVIVSSCWKTFDCLKTNEYIQQTIVHNKTFVHPPSSAGLTSFDNDQYSETVNGKKTENLPMPRFGTRRSHHLGDLAEFMFKRRFSNHLERLHAFFKQVARVYPLR